MPTKKVAGFLCAVLIVVSPGFNAYQALAQQVLTPVEVSVPLGGNLSYSAAAIGNRSFPSQTFSEQGHIALGSTLGRPQTLHVAPIAGYQSHVAMPVSGSVSRTAPQSVLDASGQKSLETASNEVPQETVLSEVSGADVEKQAEVQSALKSFHGKSDLVQRRFKALRDFFGKSPAVEEAAFPAEDVSSQKMQGNAGVALQPVVLSAHNDAARDLVKSQQPPVSQQPSQKDQAGSKRNKFLYAIGFFVSQIGLETLGTTSPRWIETSFGAGSYPIVSAVSMLVSLGASFIAGAVADKVGLRVATVVAMFLSAAAIAAVLFCYGSPFLVFQVVVGVFAFRAFMGSSVKTTEQTLTIPMFQNNPDPKALEKYISKVHLALEIPGISLMFILPIALKFFELSSVMWIFVVATVIGASILSFMKGVDKTQVKVQAKQAAQTGEKEYDPFLLKVGRRGFSAFFLVNLFIYGFVAFSYGGYLFPGMAKAATAIQTNIQGVYCAGGAVAALITSGWLSKAWAWFKRLMGLDKKTKVQLTPDQEKAAMLKSAVRWMRLGALGQLGFITLLWTSPLLAYIGMSLMGIPNVVALIKTNSIMQANVRPEKKGKVIGFARTVPIVLASAATYGFGSLMKIFPASPMPFLVLFGFIVLLGVFELVHAHRLSQHNKSGAKARAS